MSLFRVRTLRSAAAMAGDNHYEASRHIAGYSSDSSVLSHDYGHHVKRIEKPRWWVGLHSLCHTSNESLKSLCHQCRKKSLARLAVEQGRSEGRSDRSDAEGKPQPYMRRAIRYLWVTEVISGTGFYAITEEGREKAAEVRATLAAQLGDSPTMAERVVHRMICALKVNDSWERVIVKRHCTVSCCTLRADGEEQPSSQEYWHVCLMEVGTMMCVALSQLALVTRAIASETHKAKLYFLRRVNLKDDENCDHAKAYLKSQIMNNQRLTAEVFYRPWGRGRTHAEIVMGNAFLSDTLVEAGFAKYSRFDKPDQREKASEAAPCCSSQDVVSLNSRDSLLSNLPPPPPPPGSMKPVVVNSTMPELMELIDHLMKKRKESSYLTSSGSALNLAIKAHNKERVPQHQGLCEHGYASFNKYQILLRRLRGENLYIYKIRDLKESLYEQLVGMFEKWKASYREAQKKSDVAIDIIANIFLNFTNENFGLVKYKHKCKKLETSLSNEVLLQNEGQDLAQMIVPAVATKLMSSIEKLETSASGFVHVVERPLTLHQFITSSKNITLLTLETLTKDILKGLYHYHVRGIAYKHLHPDNVLMINGHAALRPIDDQQACKVGEDWPFEGVEVANKDLGKQGDVFNFGLLVLWMACKGADDCYAATMKFCCNLALIKMTMAEDPNQRPLVESMVSTNSPIFRPTSQWCSMPLKDYLREVFTDKCTAEVEEESCNQPSEMETGESTSESESIFQPRTEEESGNETTESEARKIKPSSLASTEREDKEAPPPSTPAAEA